MSDAPPRFSSRERLLLGAIVLIGFAVRFAFHQASEADPLQNAPLLDTAAYLDAAAEGGGLHGPTPPPYRPPGYVWLLRLTTALLGSSESVLALQILLDGLTACLVAFATLRGIQHLQPALAHQAPRAGLLAALLWTLSPSAIYFSGEVLEATLATFLVAALSAWLWKQPASPPRRAWIAAALLVGCAGLVRPNLLLFAVPLAFAALRSGGWRTAAAFALATLAPLLPGAIVNASAGEPVLISANGGVNLYLGNVQDEELHGPIPYYVDLPGPVAGVAWDRLGRRAFDAVGPSPAAQSRWHTREALAAMADDPLTTIARFGPKLLVLLQGYELSSNRDLHRAGSALVSPFLFIGSWALLLTLAWAGAASCWREARWRTHLGTLGWLALGLVLFFVSARHRLPLQPLVIPLSVIGLLRLLSTPRERLPWALALLGGLLAFSDPFGQRELYRDYLIDPVGRGRLFAAMGQLEPARADFELATGRDPSDGWAWEGLAALELAAGRLHEATQYAERATQLTPLRPGAWNQLGLAHGYARRSAAALAAFEEGLERCGEDGNLRAGRGRALFDLGRRAEARIDFEAALQLLPEGATRDGVAQLLARTQR